MELREQIPWVNGIHPLIDEDDNVIMPNAPAYPNIATGIADPGSNEDGRSIERGCAAADEVTFASAWIETFEPRPMVLPAGFAWAGYDDASANSFRTPGFFNWYKDLATAPGASGKFGLPSAPVNDGPSCNGEENSHALHFKGGRFNRFGAGIDHALGLELARVGVLGADMCPKNSDGSRSDLCPPALDVDAEVDSAGLPLWPLDENGEPFLDPRGEPIDYKQPHAFWDLSRYDGIAFWARRGPEGQASMLVKVQDRFTSDDLARQNQIHCKRLRPCDSRCLNHAPCTPDDVDVYRCYEGDASTYPGRPRPEEMDKPAIPRMDSGLEDLLFPRCGPSACGSQINYPDPDFATASCEPFTFPSNHESGEFCVNPGEEPAPPEERCGDGPGRTVLLTTDWQFYTIPFSELRQLNFAKTEPYLDLKSIAMLSFIFTVGWVDVYLDNVTFYRNK
ncbi:MAG TPA: hypothetical protein VHO25_19305 [Polyangiaceae bacterium]|nr:hypothetical protein [Polyangiaceae bacterium]